MKRGEADSILCALSLLLISLPSGLIFGLTFPHFVNRLRTVSTSLWTVFRPSFHIAVEPIPPSGRTNRGFHTIASNAESYDGIAADTE